MRIRYVMEDQTMIRVKKETRERLAALGSKGDTYDDIINKLIEDASKE